METARMAAAAKQNTSKTLWTLLRGEIVFKSGVEYTSSCTPAAWHSIVLVIESVVNYYAINLL